MKRILVVDDEEDIGYLVKKTLEKTGEYQVEFTSHPEQVLEKCQADPPDLVILDIVMPNMNGRELIKQLQARPETGKVLIMVTSGLGEMVYVKWNNKWRWLPNRPVVHQRGDVIKEKNSERAAEAYGVDAYLAKPFPPSILLEFVKGVLTEGDTQATPPPPDIVES